MNIQISTIHSLIEIPKKMQNSNKNIHLQRNFYSFFQMEVGSKHILICKFIDTFNISIETMFIEISGVEYLNYSIICPRICNVRIKIINIDILWELRKINELENGGNVIVKFIYNDCGFSFWSDQFLFIHLFNVH